jgi:hypothetical protein
MKIDKLTKMICECGGELQDGEKYCQRCQDTYQDRFETELAEEKKRERGEARYDEIRGH